MSTVAALIEKPGVLITGDEVLDFGSIIHWDERDPDPRRRYAMITCGGGHEGCEGKRLTLIPYRKYRKSPMAGYCRICDPRPPGQPRKYTGEMIFPNGTVAHLDKRDRANTDRVEIDCVGCGESKYAMLQSVLDPGWCQLCGDCFYVRGGPNPRKVIDDEPVAFGSIIHWSEWRRPGLRLPVTCGICVANHAPKTKREISRGNIPPKAVYQSEDFQLFCRPHSRAEVALHIAHFRNGNGQKKGGAQEKRKVEREEFESVVSDLLNDLPAHKIGRSEIAAAYDVRRNTLESLDPTTIRYIVKRCYPEGTFVKDAVALVADKKRALNKFTEIHGP